DPAARSSRPTPSDAGRRPGHAPIMGRVHPPDATAGRPVASDRGEADRGTGMASRIQLIGIGAVAAAFAAAFAWWRVEERAAADRGPVFVVGVVTDEEHRVTPEMQD